MHFLNTQTASQSSLRVRLIALCLMGFASTGLTDTIKSSTTKPSTTACASDTSGLTLPPGFCATVFADYIGHARHLVVSAEGVVYINTWSGGYYPLNDEVHSGGFIVALKDTRGTGVADIIQRFGDSIATGGAGGTGIGLYQDGLFVEANDKIVRYPLKAGALLPVDPPQTVVSGLPLTGDHPMHPFAINAAGQLFVDVATESNSCQQQSRLLESRASSHAPNLRLAEAFGFITLTDSTKSSHRARATPLAFVMAKASHWIQRPRIST